MWGIDLAFRVKGIDCTASGFRISVFRLWEFKFRRDARLGAKELLASCRVTVRL